MPKIDFSKVSDIADFAPLPDGQYQVRLVEVETDMTRSGDDMWKLRWRVEGGEHDGRLIFDNLVFSPRAMSRVKMICACCDLDVSRELDLDPSMLLDKQVFVETYQEEYEDAAGKKKVRSCIPYSGYERVPGVESDTPF